MEGNISFVKRVQHDFIPNTVVVGIYMLVGISANFIVVVVFATRMKDTMHRRYFIPYLATTDLLSCILNGIHWMLQTSYLYGFYNSALCKFWAFTCPVLVSFSILLLMSISMQRYLAICTNKANSFDKRRKLILFIILIPSIALALPRLVLWDATVRVIPATNETVSVCGFSFVYYDSVNYAAYTFLLPVVFAICVSIMIVLYALIIKKVIASNRKMKKYGRRRSMYNDNSSKPETIPMSNVDDTENIDASRVTENQETRDLKGNTDKTASEKSYQRRLCFIFLLISASVIVTYLPSFVIGPMLGRDPLLFINASSAQRILYLLMSSLYISQTAINPFIYCGFDGEFRRNLKHLLTRRH